MVLQNVGETICVMAHNSHGAIISKLLNQMSSYCSGAFQHSSRLALFHSRPITSTKDLPRVCPAAATKLATPSVSSLLEKIVAFQVGEAEQVDRISLQQKLKESTHPKEEDWLWVEELQPLQNSIETRPSLQLSEWLQYVEEEHESPQQREPQKNTFLSKTLSYKLVTEVLLAITKSSSETIESELEKFMGCLSAYEMYLILKSLPDKRFAMSFYEWIKRQPNYSPNRFIFSMVINCLLTTKNWKGLHFLMDEMHKQRYFLINRHFCRLLKACCYPDNRRTCDPVGLGFCEKWFHSLKELGFKPDLPIYHALLLAYNNTMRYESTLFLFNEMKQNCHTILSGSYQFALTACKELASLDRAEELWKDMKSLGIKPNVECYTILLGIYANCKEADKAAAFFEQMEQEGHIPDIQAYTCLLLAFVKVANIDKANRVFEVLQCKQWKLDNFVYFPIMDMYNKAERWDDVIKVFNIAKERGEHLAGFCFNLAVHACVKGKNWKEAIEIFKEMHQLRLRIEQELCETMMGVYFMLQQYGACKQLFYYMLETKFLRCQKAYELVIRAYIATGKKSSAIHVIEVMRKNLCPLTANIYHLIIPMLTKISLPEATLLYQDMHAAGILASVDLYNALIMAHIKANNNLWANKVYEEMKVMGVKPNKHMFSSLLCGYRNAAKFEETIQIYRDWQGSDSYPDKQIFGIILDMLLKAGNFADAQIVLEDMQEKGLTLENILLMAVSKGQ